MGMLSTMSLLADATSVIERWTPPSAELRTLRGETLGLLHQDADAVWREGAPTHLTAPAAIAAAAAVTASG